MPHDFSQRRRPRFKLPPGACDAHNHVFGPAAKFPYAPERRYTPEDAPKEALAVLHALLGIERAVVVQASCHGKDNRAMLDAIADAPDKRRASRSSTTASARRIWRRSTAAASAACASTSCATSAARPTWTCSTA
jgi:predicted TIM-barrel fold metal-dependent hydrolase